MLWRSPGARAPSTRDVESSRDTGTPVPRGRMGFSAGATVRAEGLDGLGMRNGRHREQVLPVYVEHYNPARPHRGINLGVPVADSEPAPASLAQIRRIDRGEVLGGLGECDRQPGLPN